MCSDKPQSTLCVYQMLQGQTAVLSPCSNGLEENRGEACTPKPEEGKRLKKAIGDLSTLSWILKGMEEVRLNNHHEIRRYGML